jgi:hypothetical protein
VHSLVGDEGIVEDVEGSLGSTAVHILVDIHGSNAGDSDEDSRGSGGSLGGGVKVTQVRAALSLSYPLKSIRLLEGVITLYLGKRLTRWVPPSGNAVALGKNGGRQELGGWSCLTKGEWRTRMRQSIRG